MITLYILDVLFRKSIVSFHCLVTARHEKQNSNLPKIRLWLDYLKIHLSTNRVKVYYQQCKCCFGCHGDRYVIHTVVILPLCVILLLSSEFN